MLDRIKASLSSLAPAEQRVGKLVLADPRAFANLPVTELADRAHGRLEDVVRGGPEIDLDVRLARGHALAGADVERHAGPAPVVDFGAQCDKGFGAAVGVHPALVAVAGHRLPIHRAGAVLAAHHMLAQGLGRPAPQGAQHLEFFVADGVGMGVDGGFHGDGAQQLQGVVLHHVAQRAGAFVETAALFHAQFFGDGDLDVGDVLAPPQRLKQCVAKAQREQVLHRRLAQVVVDPEDLLFTKHPTHHRIDGAVGRQVVPEGFFQHDARLGGVEAGRSQLLADGGEQGRRGREVHDHRVGLAFGQPGLQGGIVRGPGQVHAHIAQQLGKAGEFFRVGALVAFDPLEFGLDALAVLRVAEGIAPHANDASALGQGAVAEGLEQGRHQFAPDQIAGATEENEVKSHGGRGGVSYMKIFL